MSVFYDLASLVLVPSGYKASKVYAQKPLTADGQLTFSRASTATRVNASGLIEAVSSNVPRLDYQGSTCPKLLLEPQRTNLALYSEQFENSGWEKTSAGTAVNPAVTANYATSPSGYQDADLIVFDRGAGNTGSDYSWLYQTISTTAATYTVSCYVKAATSADVGKSLSWRNFGSSSDEGTTLTNEWQRLSVQATASGSPQEVGFYNRGGYSTGNSVSVLMWGFQAELGSYPTSYIPTTTAAVTRLADAASKTGISSLIGQTEGTVFLDFELKTPVNNDYVIGQIYNSSSAGDAIFIFITSANIVEAVVDNSGNQARITSASALTQGPTIQDPPN
jgi:hypothetical protein